MRRTEIKYRGVDDGTLRNFRCIEELEDTVRDYENEIGLLGESALESYWLFCNYTKSKGIRPITKECFYYQIHRITGYNKKKVNTKYSFGVVYTNEKIIGSDGNQKEFETTMARDHIVKFDVCHGLIGKKPTDAYKEFCEFSEEIGYGKIPKGVFFKLVRDACGIRTKRIRNNGKLEWVYTRETGVGR